MANFLEPMSSPDKIGGRPKFSSGHNHLERGMGYKGIIMGPVASSERSSASSCDGKGRTTLGLMVLSPFVGANGGTAAIKQHIRYSQLTIAGIDKNLRFYNKEM